MEGWPVLAFIAVLSMCGMSMFYKQVEFADHIRLDILDESDHYSCQSDV